MANNTNQQSNPILDRIAALPPQLKDALFSDVTADTMFEIGKRHGLLIDKFGEMAHETGMVMLGEATADDFAKNLAARLDIDRKKAEAIARDINREIFAPARDHMRGAFGKSSAASSKKEGLSALLPKGGGSTAEKDTASPEKANNSESDNTPAATLEDLEAELKHALSEEEGNQPLSVVETASGKNAPGANTPAEGSRRSGYGGGDPYREPIGEDMPNIAARPYVPGAASKATPAREPDRSGASPDQTPAADSTVFSNGIKSAEPKIKPQEGAGPFSSAPKQAGQQPVGENSPRPAPPAFAPQAGSDVFETNAAAKKENGHNKRAAGAESEKNGNLPAFRGINLSDMPKEDKTEHKARIMEHGTERTK